MMLFEKDFGEVSNFQVWSRSPPVKTALAPNNKLQKTNDCRKQYVKSVGGWWHYLHATQQCVYNVISMVIPTRTRKLMADMFLLWVPTPLLDE